MSKIINADNFFFVFANICIRTEIIWLVSKRVFVDKIFFFDKNSIFDSRVKLILLFLLFYFCILFFSFESVFAFCSSIQQDLLYLNSFFFLNLIFFFFLNLISFFFLSLNFFFFLKFLFLFFVTSWRSIRRFNRLTRLY